MEPESSLHYSQEPACTQYISYEVPYIFVSDNYTGKNNGYLFAVESGSVHLFDIIKSGENAVIALGVVFFGYRSM
jgi:hypothetical protein